MFAAFVLRELAKRVREVGVVVDADILQRCDRAAQVSEGSRITIRDLVCTDIVAALQYAHRDSIIGQGGIFEANEAEDDGVSGALSLLQELDLRAHRIGKYGFEYEALTLVDELFAHLLGHLARFVRIDTGVASEVVSVDEG